MFYRKYIPCDILNQYIECYFVWESEAPLREPMIIESPPSSFCSVVFNYGEAYTLQNKKYESLQVPLQFISGQSIYSYKLNLQGTIGMCGIVFKPAALATIFNLTMYEYVEERIDLYTVFNKNLIDTLIRQLYESDKETKVYLLEKFILQQVKQLAPKPDYIDEAANFIIEKNGMLQVADLLHNSFMSRRTFERKFFEKVGLSPKYFTRIRRMSFLCSLIAGKKKVDWPRIFYECNFYDQAHFIKDFEAFTGRSPQQYLKENTELANYVTKSHSV